MSEKILEEIRREIASLKDAVIRKNVGRILSVADGVARVDVCPMQCTMKGFGSG
jgi:F0F1-type ATP synthase alpha subunit